MSTRLVTLTPSVDAAPGESVIGRFQIHNDSTSETSYVVNVVGLEAGNLDENARQSPLEVIVPGGSSALCEIPIYVPRMLGIGQHAAAFEVSSSRGDERAVLSPFTLSIASVARVDLVPTPGTIRAKRRATFHLDITNNETQPVDVSIDGEAPEVLVSFAPNTFSLRPGERAISKGKIKGPRHLTGSPTQHNILISARGRAATTSVTAAYVQRPVFARRLRTLLGAFAVIALWLAAIGGAAFWLANRDDGSSAATAELVGVDTNGDGIIDAYFDADGNPVTATDTDGDGIPDLFVDSDGNQITGTDTDGDGIPDTFVDAAGNPIEAVDTDGDGVPDAMSDGSAEVASAADDQAAAGPTSTVVRGTVKADGGVEDISITLAPLELGEEPAPDSQPLGFSGGSNAPTAKIWSARFGRIDTLNPVRQTEPLAPIEVTASADGVWLFTDVALRQSYEVVFAKPGFDTQSFVITPTPDGSPIELDVELVPARGSLGGTVSGPGGALGGVEIVVSDGTLTFTTTSATDGAVGTWSLEGVSTPGIYTVSGTLRGYGTEVLQAPLAAGEQRSNANLSMRRGVGAISGRVVDESGQPVGGATVTATNGDVTRTTSTLTEGDIGSYNLPQLNIPGTYTVSVELDGFITQTRRIPLVGSIPNVNFVLAGETLQLTGTVTSSAGGGIVNAGVILNSGDLKFKVSTAAAPDAGSFSIDDLPPGNYTVTVEHFQHITATELITLEAGVNPPPLEITLDLSAGPEALGMGSLVVTVLDSDPLADPQGIVGATVTLVRTRTGEIERVVTDPNSANIRIDDVPIGTYTLLVSAPGFNDTPAGLVSIGLAEERRTIRLQELGQAAGKMVDSLTGETLTDYSINLLQERSTGDRFIARISEENGIWQTDPDQLSTGTYRIEVLDGDAPVGYVVRADQVLDPVAAKTMRFVVPVVTTDEQVIVGDIEADPYPAISGRVFKPRLDGANTAFQPIDDSSLTVALACNGSTPVNGQPLDVAGTISGTDYDEFLFPKEMVAGLIPLPADLGGSCEISVDADNYDPITITLANIEASDGRTPNDRRVNSALVAPVANSLDGTVFWFDGLDSAPVDRIALENVAIEARQVVSGFVPAEASAASTNPNPGITRQNISTSSGAAGDWTLNGQVFGTSDYTFTDPGFGPGMITVTVDQLGARTVSAGAGVVLDTSGPGVAVELEPPDQGALQGNAQILTVGPPKYGDITITATDPFGNILTNTDGDFPDPVGPDGSFSISNAEAGTWTVDFEPPPNHAFFNGADNSVTQTIEPGLTQPGFDTTLVELGTLNLNVFDKSAPGTPLPNATIEVLDFPALGPSTGPNGNGIYSINEIPVGTNNPAVLGVSRTFKVTVPNYDPGSAVITSPQAIVSQNGAEEVTMLIRAGQTLSLNIGLDPLGSVQGTVFGQTGPLPTDIEELPLVDDDPPGRTIVTAVQVRANGDPLQPGDDGFGDAEPTIAVGSNPFTFSVTGLPGFYRLTVTNPDYEVIPATIPADPLNPTSTSPGVFEIRNGTNNDLDRYLLDIVKGSLNIRAVSTLAGDVDVTGAVYDLFPDDASCTGTPPAALHGTIDSAGGGTDVSLFPGQYCLKINKYATDGVTPVAFPAITTLTIAPAVNGTPSTLSVRAPLPDQAPSVSGRIRAENESGGAVLLPDITTGFIVTTEYQGDTIIEVGPDTPPNLEVDGIQPASISLTSPADFSYTYLLSDLPAGEHKITAPDIPGYTLAQKTITVTVSGIGPVNAALNDTDFDFVYTVADTNVTVLLDDGVGGSYPDATGIDLESPSGATYSFSFGGTTDPTDTITFFDVSPEAGNWAFSITDALHDPVDKAVVTLPLTIANGDRRIQSGNESAGTFAMTPKLARLEGTVQQLTASGPIDLSATGTMTLTNVNTQVATTLPGEVRGTYEFDVDPGVYQLTVENSGFITTTTSQIDLTNAAGRVTTENVTIEQFATVTVNVTNVAALTNPSILLVQGSSEIGPDLNTTNVFTVVPGTYRGRITASNYPTTPLFGNKTYGTGATVTETITLPRLVSVSVNGPTTATVELRDSSGTLLSSMGPESTGNPFEFTSATTSGMAGTLNIRVSATGYRTQVIDIGDVLNAVQPVTLLTDVDVSGKVTSDQGATVPMGSTISATNGSTTETTSTTDALGNYSNLALTANEDGTIETWTISTDIVGVGIGSTTIDVSNTSTSSPIANIPAVAGNLAVTFSVVDSSDDPLAGAVVSIAGQTMSTVTTGPPNGRGKVTFSILETSDLSWNVTHANKLGKSGTAMLGTDRTVSVPKVVLQDRVDIIGAVSDGTDPVAGATVRICADGTTTICGTSLYPEKTSAASTGTFGFGENIAVGSYEIFATNTTGTNHDLVTVTGSIGLEVLWDNTYRLSPSSGVITVS